MKRSPALVLILFLLVASLLHAVPVTVRPVTAPHGMVVAAHPEAAQIGADILAAGGNAMDAAVAVSLAVGVAEPFGSGLGGKIMLLYHDAASGRTFAVDGMDEASGALDAAALRQLNESKRTSGWSSVCVPGLAAALHESHRRWGSRPWAENIAPVIALAHDGFTVLPKTRDLFEERLTKLRTGNEEIQRLYLPDGELPGAGTRLPNPPLAETLAILARDGADGFYRGPIARAIVEASAADGGFLTLEDFAAYAARVTEPLEIDFGPHRILSGPPPTTGGALVLGILKVLEGESFAPPLRSAENLDRIGRVWRQVQPFVQRHIADSPESVAAFSELVSPDSVAALRARSLRSLQTANAETANDATTHFAVVDRHGNVVCATQSQSLHFGAGVSAAGIVMNNSMSNFAYSTPASPNAAAPRRRPRSTITPTLVLRDGRPVAAVGIPGASRIPTAVLQGLLDHLVFDRPWTEAIGDTRLHWHQPLQRGEPQAIEAEDTLDVATAEALRELGWTVSLREAPGTGRHFGGLNVITLNPDGTRTGYPDPRRTNAAAGH